MNTEKLNEFFKGGEGMNILGTILPDITTLAKCDKIADQQKWRDITQGRLLFEGKRESFEQMETRWHYAKGRYATVHHGVVRRFEQRIDGDYSIEEGQQ